MKPTKRVFRIKFEKFDNLIEILPTIYYYKQTFRERFGKGAIIIGWLNVGFCLYIEHINKENN